MKVEHRDLRKILRFLEMERWNQGSSFIVVPTADFSLQIENIRPCFTLEEAQKQRDEMQLSFDEPFQVLSTKSVCYVMSNALKNPESIIERNTRVDISAMVEARYAEQISKQVNSNIKKEGEVMSQNQEDQLTNLLYLQDQVAGINVKDVDNRIEAIVSGMQDTSQIEYKTIIDGAPVKATLNFSKSDKTDYQFFNNYELELFKGDTSTKQTFYINKKQNMTLGEASRLMAGRAIRKRFISKEGQPYNVWYQNAKNKNTEGQPTLRKFYDSYGYDHVALLKVSGIKDVDKGQNLYDLAGRLEQGERVTVNKEVKGEIVQRQVDVSPMYKTLNFYDTAGKLMLSECLSMTKLAEMMQPQMEQQQQGTEQSNTVQQAIGESVGSAIGTDKRNEPGKENEAEILESKGNQADVRQTSAKNVDPANQSQGKARSQKEEVKPTTQRASRSNRRGRSLA